MASKKQMDEQFKKYRDAQTPGTQRAEEADIKKTTSMMNMLKCKYLMRHTRR